MKISVIVPSYNHERFLRQCLQSVVDQTYRDWELIVLDDRSSDGSLELAKSFESDPRVKVHLNEKNLGTYATQNAAMDLANGDWIAVLNSDDYWQPTKLERQVKALQECGEASFCYTLGTIVDDDGREWEEQAHHRDYPRQNCQTVLPYLLDVNQILASSVIFPKGSIRFRGDLRYCGDWVAALQLAKKGQAAFVDEPVTYWRQHPDNSSKQLLKTIGEEVRVRQAILKKEHYWLQKNPEQAEIASREMAKAALDLGAHLTLLGRTKEAREAFKTAKRLGQKQTAMKRLLASYLPGDHLLRRLWPGVDAEPFRRATDQGDQLPIEL